MRNVDKTKIVMRQENCFIVRYVSVVRILKRVNFTHLEILFQFLSGPWAHIIRLIANLHVHEELMKI